MISKGDFVKLSYTAKLESGEVIDTTSAEIAKEKGIFSENTKYSDIYAVVGEGHVLKGLDEELEGKEVGYKGEVKIPPEKAFGEYDPNKKDSFSITKFREKPEVGQRVRIGDKVGTVERIVGRRVIVDFNHPLAGKNIVFEYEIKEKLERVEDKLKALFLIHTGIELKSLSVEGEKAVVEVPPEAYLNQLFLLGRYRAVRDAFRLLNLKEVQIVEKFERKEEKGEKAEEGKEVQIASTLISAFYVFAESSSITRQKGQETAKKFAPVSNASLILSADGFQGKSRTIPPLPPPQQRDSSLLLCISTNSTPGIAFSSSLGSEISLLCLER